MKSGKPIKKTDKELWALIDDRIANRMYLFKEHAKKRLEERKIIDLAVLNILRNKLKRKRKKSKDKYESPHMDWNYCIEGNDIDDKKTRIIVSFNKQLMLIITAMHIHHGK